jgi:hypothetical protein
MVPEIATEKHEAQPIRLCFGKAVIHILIYKHRIYIPIHEGLGLIRVESNWLNLDNQSRRGRLLKRQKFSFERILLCYQISKSGQYVFVESIPYEDWLIVLTYFGSKENTRALSILKWLAQFGVQQHIETSFDVETVV